MKSSRVSSQLDFATVENSELPYRFEVQNDTEFCELSDIDCHIDLILSRNSLSCRLIRPISRVMLQITQLDLELWKLRRYKGRIKHLKTTYSWYSRAIRVYYYICFVHLCLSLIAQYYYDFSLHYYKSMLALGSSNSTHNPVEIERIQKSVAFSETVAKSIGSPFIRVQFIPEGVIIYFLMMSVFVYIVPGYYCEIRRNLNASLIGLVRSPSKKIFEMDREIRSELESLRHSSINFVNTFLGTRSEYYNPKRVVQYYRRADKLIRDQTETMKIIRDLEAKGSLRPLSWNAKELDAATRRFALTFILSSAVALVLSINVIGLSTYHHVTGPWVIETESMDVLILIEAISMFIIEFIVGAFIVALLILEVSDAISSMDSFEYLVPLCSSECRLAFGRIRETLKAPIPRWLKEKKIAGEYRQMKRHFIHAFLHHRLFINRFNPTYDMLGLLNFQELLSIIVGPILMTLSSPYMDPDAIPTIALTVLCVILLADMLVVPFAIAHEKRINRHKILFKLIALVVESSEASRELSLENPLDEHIESLIRKELGEIDPQRALEAKVQFGILMSNQKWMKWHFWCGLVLIFTALSNSSRSTDHRTSVSNPFAMLI